MAGDSAPTSMTASRRITSLKGLLEEVGDLVAAFLSVIDSRFPRFLGALPDVLARILDGVARQAISFLSSIGRLHGDRFGAPVDMRAHTFCHFQPALADVVHFFGRF